MSITPQFLSWLAGFIDGDGSIHIGVRIQNANGNDYIAIRPVLNITQHIKYEWVCDYIKNTLGKGQVYIANRSNASAKATWQTLRAQEIVDILKELLPYLVVKKSQAEVVTPVLESWIAESNIVKFNMEAKLAGKKLRKRKTVMDIIAVATSINADMRTSAAKRGYKTLDDWEPIVNKLYPR
jgi:predicted nucleic acid-binding protein